eukprot:9230927-Lingulodinium_polyedra.AAC.1
MGPAAGNKGWLEPVSKWVARLNAVAAARLGPVLALRSVIQRCQPVLSYVAQLLVPPKGIALKEQTMAHRALHLPGSTLTASLLAALKEIGLPGWPLLEPWLWATLARASAVTVARWPR